MKRTQEPGTGWNRGEPRKPPAVWAPPPGNARPEGRRETREKTRRGEEEQARGHQDSDIRSRQKCEPSGKEH